MSRETRVDVAILGAGTAGSHALEQVRRTGKSFVVINGGPLGTTCARVGCMPSKLLVQAAELYHDRHRAARVGIRGTEALRVDMPAVLERVRALRDDFVASTIDSFYDKLSQNPDGTQPSKDERARRIDERLIEGYARFTAPGAVEVDGRIIRAERFIIATGSSPIVPDEWAALDERALTTDTLFEQRDLPARMAVLGLGVIGAEMGQALARLGIEVSAFDTSDEIAGLSDPAIAACARELLGRDMNLHLGCEAKPVHADEELRIDFGAGADAVAVTVDKVLVCIGRRPNTGDLGLDDIGAPLDDDGHPQFDAETMQLGDLPIYLAGDASGPPLILHEAADEGRISGFVSSREQTRGFRRREPFGIVFTDPNIATVGEAWNQLDHDDVVVGEVDFSSQGRARVMVRDSGRLRIYGARDSGRVLGAAMCAPLGEHLAHLLAWSIEQKLTVFDLQQMPFYHPTLEEGLSTAIADLAAKVARDAPSPVPELRPAERE
ncbi:dihydrolipoyl dehydrogenase [Haliangium ochraceum]|nr:dihydrolipoyl dehydrogenase [Haliangium ochraceum]